MAVETLISSDWEHDFDGVELPTADELRAEATQLVSRAKYATDTVETDDEGNASTDGFSQEASLSALEYANHQRVQLLVKQFVGGQMVALRKEDQARLLLVEEKVERLLDASRADQYEALADMLVRSAARREQLNSLRRRLSLD